MYNHHVSKWTYLSDMIAKMYNHSAVSMGNKMFVISKGNPTHYELYDSISRKFTMFNAKPLYSNFYSFEYKVLGINNKLVYFCTVNSSKKLKVYVHDVVENKWIVEESIFVKYNFMFATDASFVKYPKT